MIVGDLFFMVFGINWDEVYYLLFFIIIRVYFDDNLWEVIKGLIVIDILGKVYKYVSGDIELLGMVIEKVIGKIFIEYLSESFWKLFGVEYEVFW